MVTLANLELGDENNTEASNKLLADCSISELKSHLLKVGKQLADGGEINKPLWDLLHVTTEFLYEKLEEQISKSPPSFPHIYVAKHRRFVMEAKVYKIFLEKMEAASTLEEKNYLINLASIENEIFDVISHQSTHEETT
ncbi:MAG: hypothetical protein ACQ9MH_11675 [Nitrospinales bacterium]